MRFLRVTEALVCVLASAGVAHAVVEDELYLHFRYYLAAKNCQANGLGVTAEDMQLAAENLKAMAGALVRGYGRRRNSILDAVCYGCLFLRRTESGRPVASMRLRTAQPMATSVC
jgi:hypothetical protein